MKREIDLKECVRLIELYAPECVERQNEIYEALLPVMVQTHTRRAVSLYARAKQAQLWRLDELARQLMQDAECESALTQAMWESLHGLI